MATFQDADAALVPGSPAQGVAKTLRARLAKASRQDNQVHAARLRRALLRGRAETDDGCGAPRRPAKEVLVARG